MGSDAEVYIFDHQAYHDEIVPQILEQLRIRGAHLERDCSYLRLADLAFEGRIEHTQCWSDSWEPRACRSESCPSRTACPLHIGIEGQMEDLVFELQPRIAKRCLGRSQFVGRSMNVGDYDSILPPESGRLRDLLRALGTRGRVIGYGFSNSDGIHGWLDPGETVALAHELSALDLPQYIVSFEAMENRSRESVGSSRAGEEMAAGYTWEQLSLSFVRTVATIAIRTGHGILWANDIRTTNLE